MAQRRESRLPTPLGPKRLLVIAVKLSQSLFGIYFHRKRDARTQQNALVRLLGHDLAVGADAQPAAHFLGQGQRPALIDVDDFCHGFSITYFQLLCKKPARWSGETMLGIKPSATGNGQFSVVISDGCLGLSQAVVKPVQVI